MKSLGKGTNKIKITADTKDATSKIKSLEKSVKSIGKGNHKVKVTATVTGKSKITSLKSAIKGIRGKKVYYLSLVLPVLSDEVVANAVLHRRFFSSWSIAIPGSL